MTSDTETANRRIPTLVQYCQRVALAHVDSIYSLGDELRYELVKPILEGCSAENLLRLEQASPHIQADTPELWQALCFRTYPLAAEPYILGESEEPESWRALYFILHEAETRRLDEIGSKMRKQRLEAEGRKKEREVKLTDRVPPMKRSRSGWTTNPQPKTLFQKTRTEASRIQKNMYNARMIPPMPCGKVYRILPNAPSAQLPPPPPSGLPSRVTVNTVIYRRPSTAASSTSTPPSTTSTSTPTSIKPTLASSPTSTSPNPISASGKKPSLSSPNRPQTSPIPPDSRSIKSPILVKKDPMAALFMPKHRAYSQRR